MSSLTIEESISAFNKEDIHRLQNLAEMHKTYLSMLIAKQLIQDKVSREHTA